MRPDRDRPAGRKRRVGYNDEQRNGSSREYSSRPRRLHGTPMHWARDGDFRVLTCAGGHHHVVVIRHTSGARVVVVCDGGTALAEERDAGTCRTWQEARKVAEDIAWGIGVDDLAFAGDWRSEPATPPQKFRLTLYRAPLPDGVTKGIAGDLIALAIATKLDPNRVIKRWTGPWES